MFLTSVLEKLLQGEREDGGREREKGDARGTKGGRGGEGDGLRMTLNGRVCMHMSALR